MGCCLTPFPAPCSEEEQRGQQGTKWEDEEVEDSQEAPCRWLWPQADLRGQHNPQKRWVTWSTTTPPTVTRQLLSGSSRMPRLLPQLCPANSAKVCATAEPTSAQIN